jgi:hypothetical protein
MTDTPLTTDDSWKETLAGEDETRMEALSGFGSPDDLFTSLAEAQNFDWRQAAAGDDDKFKSSLERFDSLGAFGNSFREAQQTIRSGQLKEPLAADATDDQVKAYREANGIPLEAAGYLENLPDGLVVGDEDREIMSDFMGALHNVHADPKIAIAAIEWYNGFAEAQQDQLAETDNAHRTETEDTLRADWGTDYRTNVNVIGAYLEKHLDGELRETFLNARGPDGRALMNNPGMMAFLAEAARAEMHPMAVPGQTHDPQQTVDDEIAEIEKVMREDRKAYNADEKMQARLRQLYDIRSKHEAA